MTIANDGSMRRRAALWLSTRALFVSTAALAAAHINTLKGGVFGGCTDTAILGYDTVAHFNDGSRSRGRTPLLPTTRAPNGSSCHGRTWACSWPTRKSMRRSTVATAPTTQRRTTW